MTPYTDTNQTSIPRKRGWVVIGDAQNGGPGRPERGGLLAERSSPTVRLDQPVAGLFGAGISVSVIVSMLRLLEDTISELAGSLLFRLDPGWQMKAQGLRAGREIADLLSSAGQGLVTRVVMEIERPAFTRIADEVVDVRTMLGSSRLSDELTMEYLGTEITKAEFLGHVVEVRDDEVACIVSPSSQADCEDDETVVYLPIGRFRSIPAAQVRPGMVFTWSIEQWSDGAGDTLIHTRIGLPPDEDFTPEEERAIDERADYLLSLMSETPASPSA